MYQLMNYHVIKFMYTLELEHAIFLYTVTGTTKRQHFQCKRCKSFSSSSSNTPVSSGHMAETSHFNKQDFRVNCRTFFMKLTNIMN